MIPRRLTYPLLGLALGLAATGCSRSADELPRVPAAGTVTMDGQPLPEAVIQFYPEGEASATSAGANAEVKDGKFSIPRESGPVPGLYKVRISHAELLAADPTGKKKTVPNRSKVLGPEKIPAKYNSKTELKAEIKPGGTTDLEFKLESK